MAADLLADNLGPWLRGRGRRPAAARRRRVSDSNAASRGRPPGPASGPRPSSNARSAPTSRGPGSFLETPTGRIVVWAGHVLPTEPGDRPGTFVPVDSEALALATVEGRLALDEVQPAGGRRMSGAAYRRGFQGPLAGVANGQGRVSG